MRRSGIDPDLPPLPAPFLIDWLMEIGPTEPGGMGAAVISWRTLDAWCSRTGIDLAPWQARLLRRLSGEWLVTSDRARSPDCPPPWLTTPSEESRKSVESRLEKMFDRLG